VIFTGMSIGTLFTLFVVPAFYMLIGANHEKTLDKDAALDDAAREVDQEMAPKPAH
jgi:multidrug efflux pump